MLKKKKREEKIKQTNKNPGWQAFPLEFVDKVKETNSLKISEYDMPKISPRIYKPLDLVCLSSYDVNQDSLGLWIPGSGFRILCKSKLKLKIPNVCGIPDSFS